VRKKTVSAQVRMTADDERRLIVLMEWGKWDRSEAIRFSLNFTHLMMSVIPAAVFETILDEQIIDE